MIRSHRGELTAPSSPSLPGRRTAQLALSLSLILPGSKFTCTVTLWLCVSVSGTVLSKSQMQKLVRFKVHKMVFCSPPVICNHKETVSVHFQPELLGWLLLEFKQEGKLWHLFKLLAEMAALTLIIMQSIRTCNMDCGLISFHKLWALNSWIHMKAFQLSVIWIGC